MHATTCSISSIASRALFTLPLLIGCTTAARHEGAAPTVSVAAMHSRARTPTGETIAWREHRIDDEGVNGGVAIRGGDGLKLADFDRDGHIDVVSVHEDSHHLRIAYGSADPGRWTRITVAKGKWVGAIEDVAVGDLNGDGLPDLVAACEEAHLAYFQNPGSRTDAWPGLVPPMTEGRGSWLQVDMADMDGDGRPEVLAANKGFADVVRLPDGESVNNATSLFRIAGDPLDGAAWTEQVLMRDGIPNQVLGADMDADGDLDVLAASRLDNRMMLLLNQGAGTDDALDVAVVPVRLAPGFAVSGDWHGASNAFNAVLVDLDGDGRRDIVANVLELEASGAAGWRHAGLGWLAQPADPAESWSFHRIGHTLPDWVIGIGMADIDGDGDLDAVTGGYSGLNVVRGGYSGASRDFDDPSVTSASSVARLAWFENPGDPRGTWRRHDISRRARGMYDEFAFHDLDDDGDLDIVATRGNSGEFDGVFWLEQVRLPGPLPAFEAARTEESAPLPLPPADWRVRYDERVEYIAPNKAAQEEALKQGH